MHMPLNELETSNKTKNFVISIFSDAPDSICYKKEGGGGGGGVKNIEYLCSLLSLIEDVLWDDAVEGVREVVDPRLPGVQDVLQSSAGNHQ